MSYQTIQRLPTLAEYQMLSMAVGWNEQINFDAARVALPNSLSGVVVLCEGKAVGMGRIVGDGAIFFYIQDIAVHPAHQRCGIGTRIMHELMAHIKTTAPEKAFIGLFAAPDTRAFYKQFGYLSNLGVHGMYQVIGAV